MAEFRTTANVYANYQRVQRSEPHIRLLADPKGKPAKAGEKFRPKPV